MPALESLGRSLSGRFGERYLYVAECTSTQDLLRGGDLPDGSVAVADHQTAGRGRAGRTWADAAGTSLLCSVLLRPPVGAAAPQLSLVSAAATAETVEAATSLAAQVKWPNDVLLAGGKVAGILLEGDGDAVLVGIGINVNQSAGQLPTETRTPATSLSAATGRVHDRGELLTTLLERLETAVDDWLERGLDPLIPELERRNALRGRQVSTRQGTGTAGPISGDGRLVVALESGGTTLVESGEVVVLH